MSGVEKNDIWAMFFGIVMFRVASVFRNVFVPTVPNTALTLAATATAAGLMLAPLLPIDWERHGKAVGAWTIGLLVLGLVVLYLTGDNGIETDVQLYVSEAARVTLQGTNPYTVSYESAVEGAEIAGATRRIDGSEVFALSYPGGTIATLLPQYALGVRDGGTATITLLGVTTLAHMVRETPGELVMLPFVFAFGASPFIFVGLFGGIGPLWIFPLVLGMYWWGRRPRAAAAAIGWAAAGKQLVWPILPFLAVWLWKEADDREAFLDAARTHIGWGGAAFLLPNLPFIVTAPRAWLLGTLTPVAPGALPLVPYGQGLGRLSVTGLYPISSTAHSALLVLALGGALALYAHWWPRSRWAAFVVPPVIFLFHGRYLPYYFTYFVPVAYYAWLRLQQEEERLSTPPSITERLPVPR